MQGTDDRMLVNAKIMKKWDSICHQHHFGRSYTQQVPRILGFQVTKGKTSNDSSEEWSKDQGNKNASSSVSTHLQKSSSLKELSSSNMPSKDNNPIVVPKSGEVPREFKSPKLDSLSASTDHDDRTSPTSVTSVATDLGLALISEAEKLSSVNMEAFAPLISSHREKSDTVEDPKLLYRALLERVGNHQEEAIRSIVETLTRRHSTPLDEGISRGNIWINVRGADSLGKKKLGLALAELLYSSKESLIYVDLSFREEISQVDSLLNSQITNKYELTMRGTVVDYLVEKLSKKPSIVFLDNIDKADLVVQNTLYQAIKIGRFTDWCGREANVSNCIFLGATRFLEGNKSSLSEHEEDVATAKGSSMQIVIRFDLSDDPTTENSINKRKLMGIHETAKRAHKKSNSYLDLNLPAEEGSEVCNNTVSLESDSDSSSENSRPWLEDFDGEVDRTVTFKEFDFPKLREKVSESMAECAKNVVGCECTVEIEGKAMKQITAAAYLYGSKIVEEWIEEVVSEGFVEAMGKYSLSARSIVRVEAVGEEQPQGLLPARVTVK